MKTREAPHIDTGDVKWLKNEIEWTLCVPDDLELGRLIVLPTETIAEMDDEQEHKFTQAIVGSVNHALGLGYQAATYDQEKLAEAASIEEALAYEAAERS